MKQMNKAALQHMIDLYRDQTYKGKVADYIPELSLVNPRILGLTIAPLGQDMVSVGDCDHRFTLQSISKVISLMVALIDWGAERVFSQVGLEPSGDPFNSIVKLETLEHHKPLNPMINAGAIAIASLIKGKNVAERFHRICDLLKKITGNQQMVINEKVYLSEKETGHRNRALAYFMKSTNVITGDVEEALDLYFRLCAIEVTCQDLAKIGLFLATGGYLPKEHTRLFDQDILRILLTVMMTSGMYNASGEFATKVGFPGKSGVSGGILAVVPNKMGIGVIGPAIDQKGNSVAGSLILEQLSREYDLHLFSLKRDVQTP